MCLLSRTSPRLLCTATQQKNGPGPEEEAEKTEQGAVEKALMEEKSQLEEQLKEMTVSQHHLPLDVPIAPFPLARFGLAPPYSAPVLCISIVAIRPPFFNLFFGTEVPAPFGGLEMHSDM